MPPYSSRASARLLKAYRDSDGFVSQSFLYHRSQIAIVIPLPILIEKLTLIHALYRHHQSHISTMQSLLEKLLTEPSDEKEKQDLGDRMKSYESLVDIAVPHHHPFIVRLDGNRFSKFTSKLKQPFDTNFTKAMVLTSTDLLNTYHASTAYTHSDEITLIFAAARTKEPKENESNHIFNGRISKIVSEFASYCSIRFAHHLKRLVSTEEKFDYVKVKALIDDPVLNFDARVIVFPVGRDYEIVCHSIWRSMRDCEKNCVSKLADRHYSDKQLHKKNTAEKIQMLKDKGFDYESYPTFMKHGIYCKKELVTLSNDKNESYVRHVIKYKTVVITSYDDLILELLLSKKWIDCDKVVMADLGFDDIKL